MQKFQQGEEKRRDALNTPQDDINSLTINQIKSEAARLYEQIKKALEFFNSNKESLPKVSSTVKMPDASTNMDSQIDAFKLGAEQSNKIITEADECSVATQQALRKLRRLRQNFFEQNKYLCSFQSNDLRPQSYTYARFYCNCFLLREF